MTFSKPVTSHDTEKEQEMIIKKNHVRHSRKTVIIKKINEDLYKNYIKYDLMIRYSEIYSYYLILRM